MDDRLSQIFASLPSDELVHVAARAAGVADARLQTVELTEIKTPHSDPRTIGIVRVSGTVVIADSVNPWSCVAKLIDLAVPNLLGTTVDPRIEVQVYENGYFANDDGGLRPARCHHISRPSATLTILWLEDLTTAEGPPFNVHQLREMALDLGQWNARTSAAPPQLGFPIGSDFQVKCAEGFGFDARVTELLTLHNEPMVRAMFRRQPLEAVVAYVPAYLQLVERSKTLPHTLALADCPISNFFHLPGETIAIDWAGLGSEPVGADGGRFIGSALSWGRGFAEIARSEGALFGSYVEGLRTGGSTEDLAVLRCGYLSELGFYLASMATLPTMLTRPKAGLSVEYFERRLGMPMEEIGAAAADLVDLIPSYVDEMQALLVELR